MGTGHGMDLGGRASWVQQCQVPRPPWRERCGLCRSQRSHRDRVSGAAAAEPQDPRAAGWSHRKPRLAHSHLRFGNIRYSVRLKCGSCGALASSPGQTGGF